MVLDFSPEQLLTIYLCKSHGSPRSWFVSRGFQANGVDKSYISYSLKEAMILVWHRKSEKRWLVKRYPIRDGSLIMGIC